MPHEADQLIPAGPGFVFSAVGNEGRAARVEKANCKTADQKGNSECREGKRETKRQ